jgi:hypothetical protein
MSDLDAILGRARTAIEQALTVPDSEQRLTRMVQFMFEVAAIGRAVTRAGAMPDSVRAFLDDTAGYLASPRSPLWMWFVQASRGLPPRHDDDDEYRSALDDRTALQFLLDLYRGTAAEETLAEVETDGFDEKIRDGASYFRAGGLPEDTPPHHWWWNESPSPPKP